MKIRMLLAALALLVSTTVFAGRAEFCAGFAEGYKTVKGNNALVPICPVPPITPIGSTDYREGIKAGMSAANR